MRQRNSDPHPKIWFFLIIGRASGSLQGLMVTPTVDNADYQGEIKILVTATRGPLTLRAGEHIAQTLQLPLIEQFPHIRKNRGPSSPGSSDVYWAQKLTDFQPMLGCF